MDPRWTITTFYWNREWYHRANYWDAKGRHSTHTFLRADEAISWINSMKAKEG